MRVFLVFVFVLITNLIFCQKKSDTIYIIIKDAVFNDSVFYYNDGLNNLYKKINNKFYINSKKKCNKKARSIIGWHSEDKYKVFVFKNKKGKRIEEGYWSYEVWRNGYYIFYHKNGVKKSEGVFYINEKIGKWYYYDEKGVLIKTENFQDIYNILEKYNRYPKIE